MWRKYNKIDTIEKLQQVDQFLVKNNVLQYPLMSYDIESNGLLLYKTTMIGFSFSVDSKSGFYIPFLEWVPEPKSLKTRSIDKVKYESHMEIIPTTVKTKGIKETNAVRAGDDPSTNATKA